MTHDALKLHTEDQLWQDALAAFAARDFYEVHEQLEELWRRVPAPEKDPVQGLLQAAVCLYHFARGNFAGARILRPQAIEKLRRSPGQYRGLNIAGYLPPFEAATIALATPGPNPPAMNLQTAPLPQLAP